MKSKNEYTIFRTVDSTKELKEEISLENFDPLDPSKLINSARSIQVCKENGISLAKLFHTSYEEIKKNSHPIKRLSSKYLEAKYVETETERQNLVAYLRILRKKLIQNELKTITAKRYPIYTAHTQNSHIIFNNGENKTRSVCDYNDILDKSLIRYEKEKEERRVNKEIKILLKKTNATIISHNHKPDFDFFKNPINYKKRYYLGNSSAGRLYNDTKDVFLREMDALYCLKRVKKSWFRHKQNQLRTLQQKKLANSLNDERHKELKTIMAKINEYKQEQLLDRIKDFSYKSDSLKKQREKLAKLRQNIRKKAQIKKYNVKSEVEKSMIQYKVFSTKSNRKQR